MNPALLLLAAGGSTRMGRAKQLLPYRGTTLLRHAATTALASRCRPVVVVVGCQAAEMRDALSSLPVEIVDNPDWSRGMGSSIRAGLKKIYHNPLIGAVLIMLCDQPAVTAEVLNKLIDRYTLDGSPIVASSYREIAGVPALFDRSKFDGLLTLVDSGGARELIQHCAVDVARIAFPGGAVDIDTAEDYQKILP